MLRDRIRGSFAMHMLGDALGAPHEFFKWNRDTVYTGKLEIEPYRIQMFGKVITQPVGSVTDDTQMTMCLMNSIIENEGYDRDAVALSYMAWVATKPIDLGVNTRYIFGNRTMKGYNSRVATLKDKIKTGEKRASHANGPLMRCLPLALLPDWQDTCTIDTDLSNPYTICVHAVHAYVSVLRSLLRGRSIEESIFTITDVAFHDEVLVAIEQAIDGVDRDVSGKDKGMITHALYCAIRSLLMVDKGLTPEDAIRWVITQGTNTGHGDTDTNAAISGALIGAYYGFDSLMDSRRTARNWAILTQAANNVNEKRLQYVPYDFDNQIDEYLDVLDIIDNRD